VKERQEREREQRERARERLLQEEEMGTNNIYPE
jgi:hypothetical protein